KTYGPGLPQPEDAKGDDDVGDFFAEICEADGQPDDAPEACQAGKSLKKAVKGRMKAGGLSSADDPRARTTEGDRSRLNGDFARTTQGCFAWAREKTGRLE